MTWWGVSLSLGRHMNMDIDQDVDAAGAFAAILSNKQGHGSCDGRASYGKERINLRLLQPSGSLPLAMKTTSDFGRL
jgi:hypothetical protein